MNGALTMNHADQQQASLADAIRVLDAAEVSEIGGGYPCSYLGVEDWGKMMSYESRNYSC
jgi:hypothetical protein